MASQRFEFAQDGPPKAGYAPLNFAQRMPVRGPSGAVMWAGMIGVCLFGTWRVIVTRKENQRLALERRQMRLALLPMLQAETDRRAYVQEVEYQRLEALIMKDVPDFVPGESMYNNPKLDSRPSYSFRHDVK